jgi:predicted nucleotidyltransferase
MLLSTAMRPDELAQRVGAALEPVELVRVAWLFGSQASGTGGARSDLDVAVVHARELDDPAREQARRRIVAALTDALGPLGERADVVDVDRTSSAVAFRALCDGRRVLARSESERVAAEVRIMRRYDDEAPRRELYRRAAIHHARLAAEQEGEVPPRKM